MALSGDINALLRVPGRLCVNPTDLSIAFPYGGTSLGLVRDIVAEPGQEVDLLVEENMGVAVAAAIDLGQAWAIAAVLRSPEEGQMGSFFTTEAGAVTGETGGVVHNPLTNPPGQALPTLKVLFAAYDDLESWFVYFPAALTRPKRAQQIAQSIAKDAGVAVAFWATPRASDGYSLKWKKKADLTL